MWPAFFIRVSPASRKAKPACMNMTRTAVMTTQMVLAAISRSCLVTLRLLFLALLDQQKSPRDGCPTGLNARSTTAAVRGRPGGSVAHPSDGRKAVVRFFDHRGTRGSPVRPLLFRARDGAALALPPRARSRLRAREGGHHKNALDDLAAPHTLTQLRH